MYIVDSNGDQIPILVTLAEAKIGASFNLTAFIQNIEVELF